MMDDRTLLERAAKAARIQLDDTIRPDGKAFYHYDLNALALADGGWFAPLTDDGDALRLAVALKLNIAQGDFSVGVNNEAEIDEAALVRNEAERSEVLRRAIVRAAAEIGGE